MRTARRMTGRRPVTTPITTSGIELMKLRNGIFSVRKLTFEIKPTTATGMDLYKWRLAKTPPARGPRFSSPCLSKMTFDRARGKKRDQVPENDGDNHSSNASDVSDDSRSPGDTSIAPDNLLGV
jgi:hypothetical protein